MSLSNQHHLTLSVIMPALNEEGNILHAIQDTLGTLDEHGVTGEIVVINDGSTDRTPELVKEYMEKDPRVRLVNHDKPHGFGGSFWDGVDHAEGDAVVCLPGDNENEPWEILRYFKLLDNVDIVVPFVYNRNVRSIFRNILSLVYRIIINASFRTNLNYTNGTVLYRKTLLQTLTFRSQGFFFQTDILIRLIKQGYLFAEVPYRLKTRGQGKSTAVSFPSLVAVIRGYMKLSRDLYYLKKQKAEMDLAKDSVSAQRYQS